ncbi:hypothetical protein ACFYOV_06995 [Streptomyces sp. NPDC005931]|uniref:hypothetical protein n=1 Tax=Streptomyces sp. NPDC005931 TaxID=3364737 RepID=UPI003676A8A7
MIAEPWGHQVIQFVVPVAISVGMALLNRGNSSGNRWELADRAAYGNDQELDSVERVGVYANSTNAAIRFERTVSRQWQRSVAWDIKATVQAAAKAKIPVSEAELTASLELHRGTVTTEQYASSQRIVVDIQPGSCVEILVNWYRQIQTGTLSLIKQAATSSNARPAHLTVPYREVSGMIAEVHVRDVPRLH